MKKKIASDLISLAHRILQLKDKDNVNELQAIAQQLYEQLTILSFAERHYADLQPTAGIKQVKQTIKKAYNLQDQPDNQQQTAAPDVDNTFSNPNLSELFLPVDQPDTREEMDLPGISTINKMVDEFPEQDIELEFPEPRYEKNDMEILTAGYETTPEFKRKVNDTANKQPSINELLKSGLKIGMNDRIGFVKHLFNSSEQDYNRVLSQLNTMHDKDEAIDFINNMVKPDYNHWQGKETYEKRFIQIIESRF